VIIVYRPAGAAEERYDLDDLSAREAEEIERVTNMEWLTVEEALPGQPPALLRACLFVFHKRQRPDLEFSDFDVPGWRKALRARMTREEVDHYVAELRVQFAEAPARFEAMVRQLRQVADDPADVDAALKGDGPKAAGRRASRRSASATKATSSTS
jgi:hypothetical protein